MAPPRFSGWEHLPANALLRPVVTTASPLRHRLGDALSPLVAASNPTTPCSRFGAAPSPHRHRFVTTRVIRAKKLLPGVHFYAYPPRIVRISDFLPPDWMPTIAYPI